MARKRKSMKYPKTIPNRGTEILISYRTIPTPRQGDTSDVRFGIGQYQIRWQVGIDIKFDTRSDVVGKWKPINREPKNSTGIGMHITRSEIWFEIDVRCEKLHLISQREASNF